MIQALYIRKVQIGAFVYRAAKIDWFNQRYKTEIVFKTVSVLF